MRQWERGSAARKFAGLGHFKADGSFQDRMSHYPSLDNLSQGRKSRLFRHPRGT